MKEYSRQNKKAWEYDAYELWIRTSGTPAERAERDIPLFDGNGAKRFRNEIDLRLNGALRIIQYRPIRRRRSDAARKAYLTEDIP